MRLRVLILADRDYPNPQRVYDDLSELWAFGMRVLTVVHGGADTGPDRMTHAFAREHQSWSTFTRRDVIEETHEAAWGALGLDAGTERDRSMIYTHPDLALAYPGPGSTALQQWEAWAQAEGVDLTVRRVATT